MEYSLFKQKGPDVPNLIPRTRDYFFLCLFFLRRFLRLCVAILCFFLFLPLGIVFNFCTPPFQAGGSDAFIIILDPLNMSPLSPEQMDHYPIVSLSKFLPRFHLATRVHVRYAKQ